MSDVRSTETNTTPIAADTYPLAVAVALNSFAVLLLELALTRLFSVVLFYHYAFLAISVTLLGLGAGGVFSFLRRESLRRYSTRAIGTTLSALCSVAVLVVLEVVLRTPVHPDLSIGSLRGLTLIYLAAGIPFFLTGMLFSIVFARNPSGISRLYGADLAGGALACLATVPLLNVLGAPNAIVLAAVAMAVAGIVWANGKRQRVALGVLSVSLVALIAANRSGGLIDIVYAKGERRDGLDVEYAQWNAISRVEVDRGADGSRAIVIDADASTGIPNQGTVGWEGSSAQRTLMSAAPAVCNVLRPFGTYAIIGPGGGEDILRAVGGGSPHVTGVEINPAIARNIMKGRYAEYSRHLYDLPQVEIHIADGRSWVRTSGERYDVMQMTLVDTWASTAAGAFALSENSLYTVEAFTEYFRKLKPDGLLAVTRWEFREPREALRVVSVAIEALHRLGVASPARHFIVVSQGPLDRDGRAVLVMAKKSPFTASEEATVREYLRTHAPLASLYMPSEPGHNAFAQLLMGNDPAAFARSYAFNVSPVYDNAPFFFFTLKPEQVLDRNRVRGIDWKVNVGIVVLALVLVLSLASVLAFLIIPLALRRGERHEKLAPLTYFVAVGLGYILVEIALIQRFVLFLGHPTYALTVVVFLLLLSSGAGSLLSRRWLVRSSHRLWALALIVLLISAYVLVLPELLSSLLSFAISTRLALSALLILPLGFVMGMPFPSGLRALAGDRTENSVEWAWAMNASASVFGSVLAIVIAIRFGLGITLASGACAYLVAMLFNVSLDGAAKTQIQPQD